MLMMIFWKATGLPRRKSVPMKAALGLKSALENRRVGVFRMWLAQKMQEISWAMRVAAAAPGIPHPKPATKRMSSTMFTTEAIPMAISGVRPSPTALRTLESQL